MRKSSPPRRKAVNDNPVAFRAHSYGAGKSAGQAVGRNFRRDGVQVIDARKLREANPSVAVCRKNHGITKILLTERQIQQRVKSLAHQISRDYADKDVTLISVLKGGVIFFADLIRHLTIHCGVDFISVSSYEGTCSTGVVKLENDLMGSPVGKHLIIVEDIADSGRTLAYLVKNLRTRRPASVCTCVLLDKPTARKVPVEIDYRGFEIPDEFVVGYGLDYNEEFRGLPYIGILDSKLYRKEKAT